MNIQKELFSIISELNRELKNSNLNPDDKMNHLIRFHEVANVLLHSHKPNYLSQFQRQIMFIREALELCQFEMTLQKLKIPYDSIENLTKISEKKNKIRNYKLIFIRLNDLNFIIGNLIKIIHSINPKCEIVLIGNDCKNILTTDTSSLIYTWLGIGHKESMVKFIDLCHNIKQNNSIQSFG